MHWKFREAKEEADADYVLPLKGNQQKMHAEAKIFLDETVTESSKPRPVGAKLSPATVTLAVLETLEKDHGRIETRRYFQSAQVDWCADRAKWEGLQSVGIVGARRKVGGQWTVERRYYLTSLPLDVETFARALGRGKQVALGAGCLFAGRPEPRGLRGGESGDIAPAGVEPLETRENQAERH